MAKQKFGIIFMGKRGGGEYLLNRMIEELTDNNKEFDLVVVKSTFTGIERTDRRFDMHELKTSTNFFLFAIYIFQVIRLFVGPNRLKVDKVFFVQTSPFDLPLHILFFLLNIPQYVSVHEINAHPGDNWPLRSWSRLTCFFASYVVVYSTFMERKVNKEIFTNSYLTRPLIRLEIPVGTFKPKNGESDDRFRILCIGRLKKYKGIETLIKASSLVDRDFVLQIVGSGDFEIDLFSEVNKLEIIRTWMSNEQLFSLIWNANLVVLPYTVASQSGILAISMAFDKKIVISDIEALVSQANGYDSIRRFELGNVIELAAEITQVIDSYNPQKQTKLTSSKRVTSGLWSSEFVALA